MAVRTFFWTGRGRLALPFLRSRMFRVGNAGDIFNADLVRWAYPGHKVINIDKEGRRLLLVGSVAHRVSVGDVVAGIGSKSGQLPPAPQGVSVIGVRGPLTERAFRDAGYNMSGLAFHGDPGLLITKMFASLADLAPEVGRVAFVPHFRERDRYESTRRYRLINIDDTPENVAVQIARAEVVYTSSLHGLIWAHALGRPACLVTPQTEESEFKYRDYLQSVGLSFAPSPSIEEAIRSGRVESPDVSGVLESIKMPSPARLRNAGVMS